VGNAHPDDVERRVLGAIGADGAPLDEIADRSGQAPATVAAVFHRLVRDGLVETRGELATLTDDGHAALSAPPDPAAQAAPTAPSVAVDLEEIARSVGSVVNTHVRARAAAAEAARDGVLASAADRDAAVAVLAEAFAHGRLTSAELEQRTGQALAARTHGDLDGLLAGLGGYRVAVPRRPWRKVLFGLVAFLMSPFVLLGGGLFFFGSDTDDHVAGAILLLVLLPGPLALWRWAWPRR
jgi:hypothetical protein